jgi:hypothetical protein
MWQVESTDYKPLSSLGNKDMLFHNRSGVIGLAWLWRHFLIPMYDRTHLTKNKLEFSGVNYI